MFVVEDVSVLKLVATCFSDEDFARHICFNWTADAFIAIFPILKEQEHWKSIGKCFGSAKEFLTETQQTYFLGECVKYANDSQLKEHVIPYFSSQELRCVLTRLILKGYWQSVDFLLTLNPDLSEERWETIYRNGSTVVATFNPTHIQLCAQTNTLTSSTASGLELIQTTEEVIRDNTIHTNLSTESVLVEEFADHVCCEGENRKHMQVCLKVNTLTSSTSVSGTDLIKTSEEITQHNTAHRHLGAKSIEEFADHIFACGENSCVALLNRVCSHQEFSECVTRATDSEFREFIVPKLSHLKLKSVLVVLVAKSYWESVESVLDLIYDLSEREWMIVFEAARGSTLTDTILSRLFQCCPKSKREQALKTAIDRGLWHAVGTLCRLPVRQQFQDWVLQEASVRAKDEDLAYFDASQLPRIFAHITSKGRREDQESPISRILEIKYHKAHNVKGLAADFASLYVNTLLDTSEDSKFKVPTILEEILRYLTKRYFDSLQVVKHISVRRIIFESYVNSLLKSFRVELHKHGIVSSFSEIAAQTILLYFLKFGKPGQDLSLNLLVPLLTFQKVNRSVQQEAVKKLALVKEEIRRVSFQEAIHLEEWSVVQEFANHSLYDDQRYWALREAVKKRKWEIVLVLTDHGIPHEKILHIHLLIARHSPIKMIRKLLERGADLKILFECLKQEFETTSWYRLKRLMHLKMRIDRAIERKDFKTCVHEKRWPLVLHKIRQNPDYSNILLAVNKAIEAGATHVLIQLVRHSMNQLQRDDFFPEAVKRKLWGMVRELIECGVSQSLFLDALPELIRARQYVLVSRVMELDHVGDTLKKEIIAQGFQWEEGSVVVHGINVMKWPLPVGERTEMYRRAKTLGMWQVVKRLMEEKDEIGAKQCNLALQCAVENHLWDVTEHCVLNGALVDQKTIDGYTLCQKAAVIKDWKTVRKLVAYGADHSLPDKTDMTVLQRVVHEATQTGVTTVPDSAITGQASSPTEVEYDDIDTDPIETLHCLVQFHGDLTATTNQRHSKPWHQLLQMVDNLSQDTSMTKITDQCADVVEETLFWGKDVSKSEDSDGRTALHLLCQAGRFESLYFFVARGSDPQAVTRFGETILLCAVRHPTNSMKLVAECIKLGIAHFQPVISDAWHKYFMSQHVPSDSGTISEFTKKSINHCETCSPFEVSIIKSDVEMMAMLYETGACSNKELFLLNCRYNDLQNADDVPGESSEFCQNSTKKPLPPNLQSLCRTCVAIKDDALAYLRQIAVSPRSLKSLCGIVVSTSLGINHKRVKNIRTLLLPKSQQNFATFAGITSVLSTRDPKPPHCYTVNTESNLALLESLLGREHSCIFKVSSMY